MICLSFKTGHFHACVLCKERSLFPFLILGSVFSDGVVVDQILTSACCRRQNEHIDIKRVACYHVTAILQRCQNSQKTCRSSSSSSSSHFLFPRDFSKTIEDTDRINTPLEPLRPADVPLGFRWYCSPFWGWNTSKTPILGAWIGVFEPNGQNIFAFI